MYTSMEFFVREEGKPGIEIIAIVNGMAPIGFGVGSTVEINHRDYKIIAINPIISGIDGRCSKPSEITYQIHVEEN